MSSGGSNYSTGTTGGGNQVSVDTPASNPSSYTNAPAPAPGGKGGFPSAQSPYAQQQPQVYMPPQQPSYYQQAFPQQTAYTQSSFYAPPQQYYGYSRQLGLNPERNYRNPYSRQYSPQTPIEAPPPPNEMNNAPGGFGPGQGITAKPTFGSWGSRRLNPDDFKPLVQPGPYAGSNPYTDDMRPTYAGPTNEVGQFGGPGPTDPREQMNYALGRFDSNAPKPMPVSNGPILSYPGGSRNWNQQFEGRPSYYNGSGPAIEPAPVAATQGVRPEPNYSGGLGSLMGGMSGPMQVPAASQDVINRKLQALNQGFGPPV